LKLEVTDLFVNPVIRQLRGKVRRTDRDIPGREFTSRTRLSLKYPAMICNEYGMSAVQRAKIQHVYPLAPMQTGMLFHWLEDKTSLLIFEQILLTIEGERTYCYLKKALNNWSEVRYFTNLLCIRGLAEPLQVVLPEADYRHYF